jgi:hypothetical protein
MENGSKVYGFDFDIFERATLSLLRELDPQDVLGSAPGQEEVLVLSRELAHVRAQQEALQEELMKGEVAVLAAAARALDARERELKEQKAQAQREAAHPAAECWGEAVSVIDVLDKAPDQRAARLRLKRLLRQLVDQVWLLVVPVSETRRWLAMQVFFRGGAHRDYLIHRQSPGHRRPGGWRAWSLATAGLGAEDLDLRERDHAQALAGRLEALDLARLESAPA